MPLNPAMREEMLSNPIQRANPLNDPKFKEIQGYNNYDLNNMQAITPRFGEVTPNTVFETVPGDRHMLHGNCKTVLNQIDANLYSKVNEYMDYFYVPMRCVFPINYEKIVPNPTKGSDLPWKALPQIPLLAFLKSFIDSQAYISLYSVLVENAEPDFGASVSEAVQDGISDDGSSITTVFALNQLLYLATILSRGQLLDYLGYTPDLPLSQEFGSDDGLYRPYVSVLQQKIDALFDSLLSDGQTSFTPLLRGWDFTDTSAGLRNSDYFLDHASPNPARLKVRYLPTAAQWRLDSFRAALYDCFEKGLFIDIDLLDGQVQSVRAAMRDFVAALNRFGSFSIPDESAAEPFSDGGFINPLRLAAYQLSVAEYMTNDSVDNVYTAELYMQNLRSIMFPSNNGVSQEPTFDYNGVDTEYDLLTTGAFERAFFNNFVEGAALRSQVFASTFLMLRRSLRYGDYFSTGRPNLLAVGQLGIPVSQSQVNPIDVTKNLVMQRFLNAVNWVGSRFVNYVTALFGVKPSDTGCHPTFIAHRKVELNRDTVTNTAGDQGRQTTNLIGTTDSQAIDVFIDDFGCIIGVTSFDVLPMYPSGIDRNFTNSDRYSMFNSMLQNVGDQEIQVSELTGVPKTNSLVFAYMVRYAQYKFGVSRAHGAFVNHLPGFVMKYPWQSLVDSSDGSVRISPDFIRDKPYYFDQFFAQRTGLSPAAYYHFQVPVTNQHSAARKMQYQPPVLF